MKSYIDSVLLPLTILMSSLSVISAFVHGLGVEVHGLPAVIYDQYRDICSSVFYWLIESWANIHVPVILQDILALWAFLVGVLYRFYIRVGALYKYGKLYLLGPVVFALVAIQLLNSDLRKDISPEHMPFYVMHFVYLVIDAAVVAGFFLWNYVVTELPATAPGT